MAPNVKRSPSPPVVPAAAKPAAPQPPASAPPTSWVVVPLPRNSSVSEELKKLGIAHTPELLALIALTNNIGDFRKLPVGMELKLPTLEALQSGQLAQAMAAASQNPSAMAVVENDRKMWAPKAQNARAAAPAVQSAPAEVKGPVEAKTVPAAPAGPLLTSRQSLDQFTSKLWQDRKTIEKSDEVFFRSSQPVKPVEMAPAGYGQYMATLVKLSFNRPENSESFVEGLPRAENSVGAFLTTQGREQAVPQMVKLRKSNDPEAAKLKDDELKKQTEDYIDSQVLQGNLHFLRANVANKATEAIFVHASPAWAPTVMEKVVREIVDDPKAFPGVVEARIAGALVAGGSTQNIAIYTEDSKSAERVMQAMQRYQQEKPEAFEDDVPAMTTKVAPGLARAVEPVEMKGQPPFNFSELRAELIFGALKTSIEKGLDEKGFRELIDSALTQRGIDPQHPDRNLEPVAAK